MQARKPDTTKAVRATMGYPQLGEHLPGLTLSNRITLPLG
jgi:hypothetical protein